MFCAFAESEKFKSIEVKACTIFQVFLNYCLMLGRALKSREWRVAVVLKGGRAEHSGSICL